MTKVNMVKTRLLGHYHNCDKGKDEAIRVLSQL